MSENWARGNRGGGGGGHRGRRDYPRSGAGDRQPLGGGRGQFSSSSSHPQQRDDGGKPIGRAGRFNQSTFAPRGVAGKDGGWSSAQQQQGEIQRSQSSVRCGGRGRGTWSGKLDNKSEQQPSQVERRASDTGTASGGDLRRAVRDKIAAGQKQQGEPEAEEPSSQQPGDICGWGASSEQQAVETATEVEHKKPEEQKPVASVDRPPIPSPSPSGGAKSTSITVKEPGEQKPVASLDRSPSPSPHPSGGAKFTPIAVMEPEKQKPVASLDRSPSPSPSGGAKFTSITVVEPEKQKPVASSDRSPSPSPHPSGGAKSPELEERKGSPDPKPVTRSSVSAPPSRPSPLMEHVQPASERVEDAEALYTGWMKHLHGTLDDEFKDCVVQVGEKVVLHAHKHMLARYSPVLRAKFLDKSVPLEPGDGGMVVVVKVVDGFSPRSIRAMVDYVYTGRVGTTELTECGAELFQLAGEYAIKDLQQFVESHLSSGISTRNILGMAQMAQDLSMSDLFMDCARFVDDHLVELSASDEYKKVKREGTLIADLLESAAMSKKGRQ